MWPTAQASRQGLVEFGASATFLPAGILLLRRAGTTYLDQTSSLPWFAAALALLLLAGVAVFRMARRLEYPWLLGLAAVALPFFDPTQAPYHGSFRLLVGIRDVLLVGATVVFVWHAMQRSDEMERRIHLEALAWSYTAVVVALVVYAMAADVLPALRATWVASGLLAGWVIAWVITSVRYQR